MPNAERYPGERAKLVERLPAFTRSALVVGANPMLGLVLKKRGIPEVCALDWQESHPPNPTPQTLSCFDSIISATTRQGCRVCASGSFDAILLPECFDALDNLGERLRALEPLLAPYGWMWLVVPNRRFLLSDGCGSDPFEMSSRIEAGGLALYGKFADPDPAFRPDANGWIRAGDKAVLVSNSEERETLLAPEYVLAAVRPTYNPVEHAHALFDAGHPDRAYEVLTLIPSVYLREPEVKVSVEAEMLLCLLAVEKLDRAASLQERLSRLNAAQGFFYDIVSVEPLAAMPYRCMAELWHRFGNDDLASRLLRSVLHAAPDPQGEAQIENYAAGMPRLHDPEEPVPEWTPSGRPPRILFITHPRPHFGIDVLYDGLGLVLGDENVVEFPWKPILHGESPQWLATYPCSCRHGGQSLSLEAVVARLESGAFDCVVYGDIERSLDRDQARRIVQAARGVPFFLVDEQDEFSDARPAMLDFLGVSSIAGYFKREMLANVDYGPDVWPLPFAYPDGRIPDDVSGPRPHRFFWAGHRAFGLRRLYLERIESMLGETFSTSFDPHEYARRLRVTRIGVNVFGLGFDTVRYWELPAHGCLLLSERLPIRIPGNFRDGESAVFFDDLADLERKLEYWLARPEESARIALAGHAHLKRYHTASARARQALARIR